MTIAFSTSSPIASVALLDADGRLLASDEQEAKQRASGVCLRILDRLLSITGRRLEEANVFAADVGPGSFTGVRVGVTLAKTFAFAQGALCVGATAFDLIDPSGTVVLPSRRGEHFIRRPGRPAFRSGNLPDEPHSGFGFSTEQPIYPLAARFGPLLQASPRMDPMRFNPDYLIEPSISKPKKPFLLGGNAE